MQDKLRTGNKEAVTACLITWKRQNNLAWIVPNLLAHPFIDEVIISDNSKGDNIINYARYTAALRAKNDLIYIQDDDAIISGIDKIYSAHKGSLTYGRQEHMEREMFGGRHMAILGWGAIFNRKDIKILDKYTDVYGKDYCFYRETDRIFSMLLGGPHNDIVVEVEHLKGHDDEHALSSKEDHIYYKNLAIERCLHLVNT